MKTRICFLTLIVLITILSCKTGFEKVATKVSDPFEDYAILSVPREKIPIGAQWIQGIGPAESDNVNIDLTNKKSLSTLNLSQEFKNKLNLALFDFIGIDEGYQKKIKLDIQKMSVVRPKNINDLVFTPGKSYVFEGIMIENFSMNYDKNLGVDLEAKIETKLGSVDVNTDLSSNKIISVKAENIFLAYRVIKINEVINEKKESRTASTNDNMSYYWNFKNFRLTLDKSVINTCFTSKKYQRTFSGYENSKAGESMFNWDDASSDFNECLNKNFLLLANSEKVYANDGKLFESTYKFNSSDFVLSAKEDYLGIMLLNLDNQRYLLNNTLLNSEIIQDYLIIDKLTFEVNVQGYNRNPKHEGVNATKISKDSRLSVFRNRIKISNLKSPNAPGW